MERPPSLTICSIGKVFRPHTGIDVSSDRSGRRNPAETGNDVWLTDIASMHDMRHAGEPLRGLRAQQAVCVRCDFQS